MYKGQIRSIVDKNISSIGSILLNIHEVWARPKWGGSCHQNKTPVDHFIGNILFASLEGDKRPDTINQNQESWNILCHKQENNVSIFRVPPLIKIICLFAAGRGGFATNSRMTNF